MTKYLKIFDLEDACIDVQPHQLSDTIMNAYRRQHSQLQALNNWVYKADRSVLPLLKQLSKTVDEWEPIKEVVRLYRGFNPYSFQESLGFDNKSDIEVGQKGVYKSNEKAFSTSTEEEIAKKFGHIVIQCDVNLLHQSHLRITDNLAAILCDFRGLKKPVTQKEVILFPNVFINWEIIHCGG